MDELVQEFIAETLEGLQKLDNQLVELEKDPESFELLSSIFRVMHTIKGTCGFLGLNKLASIAHAGENIMDKIRNKQLSASQENITMVLEAIDAIKAVVDYIQQTGTEPETDYTNLIQKLNDKANAVKPKEEKKPEVAEVVQVVPDEQIQKAKPEPQTEIKQELKPVDEKVTTEIKNDSSSQTIRVHVDILENLMQIISELVLNRNQLIQLDRTIRDNRFSPAIQRLNAITTSLQETVMETRMQPISNAWLKLPRLIRDLSNDLKKKIKLVMLGEETELDRQLIESIKDPIMHMVRNSADHGLELPAERVAAGKPEEGTITLNAYHQGGHIIIEISDDGRGINIAKVKAKAIEKKLASEKELAAMSDSQITQFIFKAGFSTAEVVTAVSGRGVGMDVVKNNIEAIRGTVDLKSVEGQGTFFTIKIPLTLAIMPILVLEVAGHKFGLPQINVIEMVKAGTNSEYKIEEINDHKILRLRESLLPLVNLSDILKFDNLPILDQQFIIICEVNSINFGIVVDKIYDMEEIVLKPVSSLLKSISLYSGNTLLGNGEVIMIIDPSGVLKYSNISSQVQNMQVLAAEAQNKTEKHKTSSFLVLKSNNKLKAVPLELISRLEEIDLTKVEYANERKVIQYRDTLMYLSTLDPNYELPKEGMQQVVVFGANEHILGLIVEEILDIVEEDIETSAVLEESDLTAVVLAGKTMDIIDVNEIFVSIFHNENIEVEYHGKIIKVLIVDDSPFFRKMLAMKLKRKTLDIITAADGKEALQLLKKNAAEIDIVITDISMPDMDGLEFIKLCRAEDNIKSLPIMVLTANPDFVIDKDKFLELGVKHIINKSSHSEILPLIYSELEGGKTNAK